MTYQPTIPIAVGGHYVGSVISHQLGVQFLAVDKRVSDMNLSIWPSAEYAERAASQLFKSAR